MSNRYFISFDEEMAYERELHKQLKRNWSYARWVSESQSYMEHKPKWWIAVLATLKWPKFNRQQLKDASNIARANATPLEGEQVKGENHGK